MSVCSNCGFDYPCECGIKMPPAEDIYRMLMARSAQIKSGGHTMSDLPSKNTCEMSGCGSTDNVSPRDNGKVMCQFCWEHPERYDQVLLSIKDTGEAEELMKMSKEQLVDIIDNLSKQLQKASLDMLSYASQFQNTPCKNCGCMPCAGQSADCAPHGRG